MGKICTKCKVEKELSCFKKDSTKNDGLYSSCKDCCKLPPKPKLNLIIPEGMKYCPRCKEIKELDKFNKDKAKKFGCSPLCRDCNKKYRNENKHVRSEYGKKYYKENREKIDAKNLRWRQNNKEKSTSYTIKYKNKHPERLKEAYKRYNLKYKNYKKEYVKNRCKKDPEFKMERLLRTRIINSLKRNSKSATTKELLGCSIPELKNWLEMQFTEGMSWNNHGKRGWHVDHIIPCAAFDLKDPKQQRVCFNYKNLRPLWWNENITKRDKVPEYIKRIPGKI